MHGGGPENFWIDELRHTFGCHACDFHGDAINLFAFTRHLALDEAIKVMAKSAAVRTTKNAG